MTDDLTCPRCGKSIDRDQSELSAPSGTEQERISLVCPVCDAPLEVVVESAPSGASECDVWVEDRRGSEN